MSAVQSPPDVHAALHEVFGFHEFRALQEDAIRAALSGQDVLVVMPTGAGKSLCFQLPAVMTEGLTLVVSPLVALMRDQVESLRARPAFRSYGVASLNSLQGQDEQRAALDAVQAGLVRLLYVAPERFRSGAFQDALRNTRIARFVVDEAHCISEWGHDFRPDYLQLREIVDGLARDGAERPPIIAVTATATLRVQQSIIDNIGMRDPQKFIGGFNRPNLHYAVHRCKNDTQRQEMLARALPKLAAMGGSGLIYAATRKQCEEVAALASRALAPMGKKAAAYHAGLESNTRNALQSSWIEGETAVLAATNAFGMGIDKADVRFVVHYTHPESLESYYQEAGRAGRDGRRSRCVVLYHWADRRTREWFIENDALEAEDVKTAHAQICLSTKDDVARIARTWWQNILGWNEVKTRLALGELERAGLVQRQGETGDELILRIVRRDFPREALQRINADLARQRDERLRRLDEMVAYCKTDLCRRRTTLSYFGDFERPRTQLPSGTLFCCDNCEKKEALAKNPPASNGANGTNASNGSRAGSAGPVDASPAPRERIAMPLHITDGDIHAILQGLDALWPQVGRARLSKVLRGANSKEVQRFRDENCPVYGALRGVSQTSADTFLDALLDAGLLHQADEDEYFVCRVTRAGREAWQTKSPLEITVPGNARNRDDLEEHEGELFEALRDWRRDQARSENLPAYAVLPDRTLLEMARQKPLTEDALRAISGIGNSKMEKYGTTIINLLREL
jgi:ATP-dependent DNA helicase RecQ